MNTPTHWQTTVSTYDPARAALWANIFGENRAPIKSPIPTPCTLPVLGQQPCYLLDLAALTREQFDNLALAIAHKFSIPYLDVLANLRDEGVPIPVAECTVISTDSGMMANILDWPLNDEYSWLAEEDEEEYF